MSKTSGILRGVVHGRSIELDEEAGFQDGQIVAVVLSTDVPVAAGIRRSSGAWSDDLDELDSYLEETRRHRQQDRPGESP